MRTIKNDCTGFVMLFALACVIISIPSLIRLHAIHEIYLYPEAREHTLNSVFLLREEMGLTIADLSIHDFRFTDYGMEAVIKEKYHGLRVERDEHDDLQEFYSVTYDREEGVYGLRRLP